MLQNRVTILSTRNVDETLVQDASSKNVYIDVISFIKIEQALTSQVLKEIQRLSEGSEAITFTSSNAVEVIAAGTHFLNTNLVRPKIFCIGYATKQSVVKYFGEEPIAGVADNAEELAKTIVEANVSDVIFFCGDQRRDELPGSLKKNNIGVKEIVVYKTIATPVKIEKKYDGILFFSPSAVKSFFKDNGPSDETIFFAIGNTTANEIKNFSKNKVVVGDRPDTMSLLNKAISYFQTNPIHH